VNARSGRSRCRPHLLSRGAVDYLVAHAYSCVLWNSVPRDWVDPDLHDIPDACLARLPGFIDAVRDRGMALVPEVPRECAPIVDGRVVRDLGELVARPASA
jgi:hypothetical protein